MLKKIHGISENDVKADRYLITYADLITLLLGLFVILYASSKVDEEKYKEFSEAFTEYFKPNEQGVLEGGKGILSGIKNSVPEPIFPYASKKSLNEIYNETENALKDYLSKGTLKLSRKSTGVILTLPESLLFQSGKAEVQEGGIVILKNLASVLQGIEFQITVDGHTDAQPIRTFRYESNWHLSVARALNVGYTLISEGVPEKNMVIRGFGSQRPVADNISPEGKMQNRRVEITISELPSDALSTEGYTVRSDSAQNKTK